MTHVVDVGPSRARPASAATRGFAQGFPLRRRLGRHRGAAARAERHRLLTGGEIARHIARALARFDPQDEVADVDLSPSRTIVAANFRPLTYVPFVLRRSVTMNRPSRRSRRAWCFETLPLGNIRSFPCTRPTLISLRSKASRRSAPPFSLITIVNMRSATRKRTQGWAERPHACGRPPKTAASKACGLATRVPGDASPSPTAGAAKRNVACRVLSAGAGRPWRAPR